VNHRFRDVHVSQAHRFSIGIEELSGRYYLSIPVSNGLVDYEEYYEIDRAAFDRYRSDPDDALPFVIQARQRALDHLLLIQPGPNRGVA
jgi:hypothetical protein